MSGGGPAPRGRVYLVGAGPGAPDLITVRGVACLRQADAVLYDRLVHPALLDHAPRQAERIFVGKAPGRPRRSQAGINALLVSLARAGRTVVRLKGGDPFVFGRGGEEAAACAAGGVPWEAVPGVTSAVGVPGMAAIPVTSRGVASSFAVVTARTAAGHPDPDWKALARIDTLVVLMGARRLAEVASRLVALGRSGATPAAVVERGTLPGERVVTGTLGDIAERARAASLRAPATLVIGRVAALRAGLCPEGRSGQEQEERARMRVSIADEVMT